MPEPLSQVVVHSFIAALVVEALVRLWEVPPSQRVTCRLASLALPLVLLPVLELLAPFRHAAWFTEGPALFASRHLVAFPFNPLWPVFALGVVLLLRDLRAPSPPIVGGEERGEAQRAHAMIAALAAKTGRPLPRLELVDSPRPLLLCVGFRSPRILVSTGLLAQLDDGELEAALAHELSHAGHRDVPWSWALLALRVLQPFSPAAQVVGRVAARELEWRADADAVRWTRRPLALASALLKVHSGPIETRPGVLALSQRARAIEVEARCRRLLDPAAETPVPPALLVAAGLGLTTLLFFVT